MVCMLSRIRMYVLYLDSYDSYIKYVPENCLAYTYATYILSASVIFLAHHMACALRGAHDVRATQLVQAKIAK